MRSTSPQRHYSDPGPEDSSAFFLGVRQSATGRAWRDRLSPELARLGAAIARQNELPELLGRILAGREVTPETCAAFLDPTLRETMPDPAGLTDMEAAAERIAEAVRNGEQIAVFGDYDVDGATSAALLARFLRAVGSDAEVYIPDRIFEGYGPSVEALRTLQQRGAKLLVCVDCGSASHAALDWAAANDLDVIVFDHHQVGGAPPPALALVNPNRQDDLSGCGGLAAVGVTYLAVVAVNRVLRSAGWYEQGRAEPDLLAWLDLVALGTVCDVVPLTGLNRAFVVKGLLALRRGANPGLAALAELAGGARLPDTQSLGFILGPRINAGGRIGRADLGAQLLATEDREEAREIAVTLDRLNSERQEIERRIVHEAMAEAEAGLGNRSQDPVVLVTGEGWHPGVVGLVATRLKDRFRRPALAIAFDESGPGTGIGTGSARSIPGVDLGGVVREALSAGLIVKGGGHAMAAGLTLERENLPALRAFLHEKLSAPVLGAHEIDWLRIDGAMTAAGAGPDFLKTLDRAGPYGCANPEPCFAFPGHRIAYAKIVGRGHVRCTLQAADGSRIEAIAFRAAGQPLGDFLLAERRALAHVAGHLRLSHWNGRTR
ncbi:MAG: single-stranded-DNA-specific exonuclease RecJ, partial [Hyphomicrobiales bacterium]|nr:single-stranded-DNA-specific exonuclease RecJ [Hyphomicrobiales bacterium]